MQAISSLNFYVAQAMLHTVENMKAVLSQANSLMFIIAKSEQPKVLEMQEYLCKSLTILLDTAHGHVKSLELTLLEEMDMTE